MVSLDKSWHPTDFGFFKVPDKESLFISGNYELRGFPNEMWLLRRKQRKGTAEVWMVKFYYLIRFNDYEFANWLLNKRLSK